MNRIISKLKKQILPIKYSKPIQLRSNCSSKHFCSQKSTMTTVFEKTMQSVLKPNNEKLKVYVGKHGELKGYDGDIIFDQSGNFSSKHYSR